MRLLTSDGCADREYYIKYLFTLHNAWGVVWNRSKRPIELELSMVPAIGSLLPYPYSANYLPCPGNVLMLRLSSLLFHTLSLLDGLFSFKSITLSLVLVQTELVLQEAYKTVELWNKVVSTFSTWTQTRTYTFRSRTPQDFIITKVAHSIKPLIWSVSHLDCFPHSHMLIVYHQLEDS